MNTQQKMVYWHVYLKGNLVDIVSYTPDCDYDYVYKSLVEHDGLHPDIVLVSNKV